MPNYRIYDNRAGFVISQNRICDATKQGPLTTRFKYISLAVLIISMEPLKVLSDLVTEEVLNKVRLIHGCCPGRRDCDIF